MEGIPALNNERIRLQNRGLVFRLIAANNGISRTEISNQSGLTKMAVSYIISEFLQKNYVVETTYTGQQKMGNKPIMIQLSPNAPKIIGILVHRTHVSAVLCDCKLGILNSQTIQISNYTSNSLLEQVFRVTDAASAGQPIIGIGIASVGPVDIKNGLILDPPNFCGIRDLPIVRMLEQHYGVPAFLDYHYNSAALAESVFGAGTSYRNFIFFGISEGIGMGIIVDGKLYSDFTGYSSEIGHVSLDYRGPQCFCGNRGCLGDLLRQNAGKPMEIDLIATALSGICNLLNPQAIIVGDEHARWDKSYLACLEEAINSRSVTKRYRYINVLQSYRSKDLEAAGGAMNVVNRIFNGELLFNSNT